MKYPITVLVFIVFTLPVFSQKSDSTFRDNNNFAEDKKIQRINKRFENLGSEMENCSSRFLKGLKRREDKYFKRLKAVDSVRAKQLVSDEGAWQKLKDRIHSPLDSTLPVKSLNDYVPGLDTLNTAIKTLIQRGNISNRSLLFSGLSEKTTSLQQQLAVSGNIKEYAGDRVRFLQEQLGSVISARELKALNKKLYYYRQSFDQYKEALHDDQKMQQHIVAAAKRIPAFNDAIQKNSWLAALFPVPDNPVDGTLVTPGSQSISNVTQQLTSTYGGGTVDPGQYMQQQVAQVQSQTNSLTGQLQGGAMSSGDASGSQLPGFSPNTEKGKHFWKRLEYGFNMQFQKGNNLLPVSSDLGLNAGYRFSQHVVAGLGASYKIGWGNSLSNIRITSEGVGLRSFLDVKAYKNIWMVAAWEYNYLQRFADFHELKNLNAWQKSALAGVSKRIKQGKRVASAQLLYDFLASSHTPHSQPLLIRFGYTL